MRLKVVFGEDLCGFGPSISKGVLFVGGVFTAVRIIFSSTANVVYGNPPPTACGSTLRVENGGW